MRNVNFISLKNFVNARGTYYGEYSMYICTMSLYKGFDVKCLIIKCDASPYPHASPYPLVFK